MVTFYFQVKDEAIRSITLCAINSQQKTKEGKAYNEMLLQPCALYGIQYKPY